MARKQTDSVSSDPPPEEPDIEPGDLVIELDENSVPHVYTATGKTQRRKASAD